MQSITFNTVENKIIIELDDSSSVEYTKGNKEQYLSDYPDRESDIVAMGWDDVTEDSTVH